MYVYEFVVFDIVVYIHVFNFDVRTWTWILWLRYRTRYRRKSFDISGQRASDWSLLRISYPISKFLTSIWLRYRLWQRASDWSLLRTSYPISNFFTSISKSWLRYRMWQRASDWSLLQISYPISKFFTSISKSCLRYRSLWVPYIVKSSKNAFDIEVKNFDIEI